MAGDKKDTAIPEVGMAGLMGMISAMGDDEMLTVEIIPDAGAAPIDFGAGPGKGGNHGE